MNGDLTSKYQSFIEHSTIRRMKLAREMARHSVNADAMIPAIDAAMECQSTALRNAKEILDTLFPT